MSVFKDVEDFHKKYKQTIGAEFNLKDLELRHTLIREEYKEVKSEYDTALIKKGEIKNINKEALTKELADLIYVTVGFAVTFGLPLEEVWDRVHQSNMSKNGGVRYDGKILKGDEYKPPQLGDLFK